MAHFNFHFSLTSYILPRFHKSKTALIELPDWKPDLKPSLPTSQHKVHDTEQSDSDNQLVNWSENPDTMYTKQADN